MSPDRKTLVRAAQRLTAYCRGKVLLSLSAVMFLAALSPLCSGVAIIEPWAALYGGEGSEEMEGMWVTSDGGFIVTGATNSYGEGKGDAWIVKLNASGGVEWQKVYGGDGTEYAIDAKHTAEGGYIVAGWTTSFGAGGADFWVLKLDPKGNVEWQRTYGGAGAEQAWSVDLTGDGGYVVAGGSTSFGAGGADLWVLKLDRSGDIDWQRTYGGLKDDGGGGGAYEEYVVRVLEEENGNYVVASNTLSFGAGGRDIWVLGLDSEGEILWQKAYGGVYGEYLWSFQETEGGYIIPGVSESFSPDESGDLWVLELDRSGGIEWQRVYGVQGYWYDALSVGATSDGGSIVGGYYEEERDWDLTLLRLDSRGNVLWHRAYEYSWDWPNAIQELDEGGYVVAGVAWQNDAGLAEDLLVMRLAEDGTADLSCGLVREMSIEEKDTGATPVDTDAIVKETGVAARKSSAVVHNTSAEPDYLCGAMRVDSPRDTGGKEGNGAPGFAAPVLLVALLLILIVILKKK